MTQVINTKEKNRENGGVASDMRKAHYLGSLGTLIFELWLEGGRIHSGSRGHLCAWLGPRWVFGLVTLHLAKIICPSQCSYYHLVPQCVLQFWAWWSSSVGTSHHSGGLWCKFRSCLQELTSLEEMAMKHLRCSGFESHQVCDFG